VIHDAMVMIGVRLYGKQEVRNELARHFLEAQPCCRNVKSCVTFSVMWWIDD
jgi:hypothetical protein